MGKRWPFKASPILGVSSINQGPVSRKSRKLFGSEKPFVNLRPAYSIKLVFVICCKENKNWNNCKVSCLEAPSFWRYKENYITRNTPEKFRDFRETGPRPQLFKGWIAPFIGCLGFDSIYTLESSIRPLKIWAQMLSTVEKTVLPMLAFSIDVTSVPSLVRAYYVPSALTWPVKPKETVVPYWSSSVSSSSKRMTKSLR